MGLVIGNSTTRKEAQQVALIPVVEVKASKGIDKNRFAPDVNQVVAPLIVVSWGYCFCDNCNTEKVFKRTVDKVVCGTCSYIIAYLYEQPVIVTIPKAISLKRREVTIGLF